MRVCIVDRERVARVLRKGGGDGLLEGGAVEGLQGVPLELAVLDG